MLGNLLTLPISGGGAVPMLPKNGPVPVMFHGMLPPQGSSTVLASRSRPNVDQPPSMYLREPAPLATRFQPQSRKGSTARMSTCRTSPGSAPTTWMGPDRRWGPIRPHGKRSPGLSSRQPASWIAFMASGTTYPASSCSHQKLTAVYDCTRTTEPLETVTTGGMSAAQVPQCVVDAVHSRYTSAVPPTPALSCWRGAGNLQAPSSAGQDWDRKPGTMPSMVRTSGSVNSSRKPIQRVLGDTVATELGAAPFRRQRFSGDVTRSDNYHHRHFSACK
mmetsp:Transcript_34634/g.98140  ORF Transcript_34634/g.98140 Transcript_34634/m.98140 type:complete len:275 (+) Transcript_34634:1469-2293(+)